MSDDTVPLGDSTLYLVAFSADIPVDPLLVTAPDGLDAARQAGEFLDTYWAPDEIAVLSVEPFTVDHL